ncbi:hypothetical protein D3C87_1960060 [compost metagenome]
MNARKLPGENRVQIVVLECLSHVRVKTNIVAQVSFLPALRTAIVLIGKAFYK